MTQQESIPQVLLETCSSEATPGCHAALVSACGEQKPRHATHAAVKFYALLEPPRMDVRSRGLILLVRQGPCKKPAQIMVVLSLARRWSKDRGVCCP